MYLLINAGERTKALTKIQSRPIERSNPKLAVPSCGETARLPKLAAVVSELKTTARAVLDFRNSKCVRVYEKRWYICMELSIPKPKSKGSAIIFAKFTGISKRVNKLAANKQEKQTGETIRSDADIFLLTAKTTRKIMTIAVSKAWRKAERTELLASRFMIGTPVIPDFTSDFTDSTNLRASVLWFDNFDG